MNAATITKYIAVSQQDWKGNRFSTFTYTYYLTIHNYPYIFVLFSKYEFINKDVKLSLLNNKDMKITCFSWSLVLDDEWSSIFLWIFRRVRNAMVLWFCVVGSNTVCPAVSDFFSKIQSQVITGSYGST